MTIFIDAAVDGVPGTIQLSLPQLARSEKFVLKLSQGLQRVNVPVMTFSAKDDVKPWWPQGYGEQNLYAIKVYHSLTKINLFLLSLHMPNIMYGHLFGPRVLIHSIAKTLSPKKHN